MSTPTAEAPATMKLAEIARRLHCCPTTVRRLIDDGVLKSFRLPGGPRRVLREDVERLAAESGVPASTAPAGE
jgi:excisionase family DNA binding protein